VSPVLLLVITKKMNLKRLNIGFILLVLLCSFHENFAQSEPASILGKVLLDEQVPAASASVKLKELSKNTIADEHGNFRFRNIPAGIYTLEISMVGFETYTLKARAKSDPETVLVQLKTSQKSLDEVVVTGQYEPQSLKKSVFQVRTINQQRIQQRGATNMLGLLNNELGIRFTNDNTLGTTDIQLMGMTGRNVKILLDGVPMVDRGDTRESLNQIDINAIERIEIVEGPMSVNYGSDALAGVINIITKKPEIQQFRINLKLQEETVGKEYSLTEEGVHNRNLGLSYQKKGWSVEASGTQNNFGGWQGYSTTRVKDWLPKDQLLGTIRLGYTRKDFNIWYRNNALGETILSEGLVNTNTQKARDQKYITRRMMHQAQSEWKINDRFQWTTVAAITNYTRRTQTSILDLATGSRTLSLGQGEQDVADLDAQMIRSTLHYKISDAVSLQPGIDFNREQAGGQRILGNPVISDLALFVSSSVNAGKRLSLRPGLRFIRNSVYDAPPVIPSVNTKLIITPALDLRLAYARGFRSPALRELYFNFFDASHSIKGNPNLKAEYSNSFNGYLVWTAKEPKGLAKVTLGSFYNQFNDLISYGIDPSDPSVNMTVNIDKFKTTGGTLEAQLRFKNLESTIGYSHIGRYNSFTDNQDYADKNLATFLWSPEVNANVSYTIPKVNLTAGLFYKFTGKRPGYLMDGTDLKLTEISAFSWADFTLLKTFKAFNVNAGVKNIFNITRINNTATNGSGAHSTGGPVATSYGRSYFLGLNYSFSSKQKNK